MFRNTVTSIKKGGIYFLLPCSCSISQNVNTEFLNLTIKHVKLYWNYLRIITTLGILTWHSCSQTNSKRIQDKIQDAKI